MFLKNSVSPVMQFTSQLLKDVEPREYSNEQLGDKQEGNAGAWETENAFVSEWSVVSGDWITQTLLNGM